MFLRIKKFWHRLGLVFRLRLAFVLLVALTFCGVFIAFNSPQDLRFCFMENIESPAASSSTGGSGGIDKLEDVLLATVKPIPARSIFFHETSCHQMQKKKYPKDQSEIHKSINLLKLSSRQACAIESAALHNPNFSIFVLFASPTYRHRNSTSQPIVDAILTYPNVHLRNLNLWSYAAGTPLEKWLQDGKLFKSVYVLSHLSDFLRYLTLYRYGGTYLDMDIVMLRSIEKIPPNFSGAESNTHLAAGVMNFAPDGFGHEIAEQCLLDFQHNFDGNDWGNNGPGVITRVAQNICGTKDIQLMIKDRKRCMGLNVYGRDAFYAIPWLQWNHFFEPEYLEETLARTRNSIVVHVWNKHSSQRKFKVGTSGAYGKFAEQNCPKVYAATGEYF